MSVVRRKPEVTGMALYSAFIFWLIFNELFILAILRKSSPFGALRRAR